MRPLGLRVQQPDGTELTLAPVEGNADLYYFNGKSAVVIPVSLHAAARLAWFILVRWWMCNTLFGLRPWLTERRARKSQGKRVAA